MENRYKFRGKCAITGVWRYGFYYTSKGNHIIRDEQDKESIVLSATVGQFTGLKDKNGKEIFEGDIVKPNPSHISCNCEVSWGHSGFSLSSNGWNNQFAEHVWKDLEIIGTIHDRKEVKGE